MNPDDGDSAAQARAMAADLRRLIEALDKRVPRLERAEEVRIARDAADLRERASDLIRQIDAPRPLDRP